MCLKQFPGQIPVMHLIRGELRHSLFPTLPFGMRAAEVVSEGFNGQIILDEDSWIPFNDCM